jgi:biotin operon repressor
MISEEMLATLLEFHKTLADETRLKMIGLLALKPYCGQELSEHLGVTAPTVSHHIAKLKNLGLVRSVREDNNVYYSLDVDRLHELTKGVLGQEEQPQPRPVKLDERQKVLATFMDKDGHVKELPVQRKRKLYVLQEILKRFEPGRNYTEKEVNEIIKAVFEDYCTVRREFIMNNYMSRENAIYRLNPEDQWLALE